MFLIPYKEVLHMWWQWFPWRWIVRKFARQKGFLDPLQVISRLERFGQPSEVAAPTELLRSGVILHARGLMNSQAIQHNLDWVWPYWVERQFDPQDDAFVPRAFSFTHINLTHRNWTALGFPNLSDFPIVDPRGLVTPLYDSWSLDAWIVTKEGNELIPSRMTLAKQQFLNQDNLLIQTQTSQHGLSLESIVSVDGNGNDHYCEIHLKAQSEQEGSLVVSLRPYNPEGVSFVHTIALMENRQGWKVNKEQVILFSDPIEKNNFSYYRKGDVFSQLALDDQRQDIVCKVGLATAAASFHLKAQSQRQISIRIPLNKNSKEPKTEVSLPNASQAWKEHLEGICTIQIPDKHFEFLFQTAVKTIILHSPHEVYPGPYTYRRFWFRDAAFILYALLAVGFKKRVENALELFSMRQTSVGYFLSQEGEWDSNGEALWIIQKYCQMTNSRPSPTWEKEVKLGAQWISKKRTPSSSQYLHAGLLPAGFSAEHLGPNDFYYWDDFWGVAGLKAAAYLLRFYGEEKLSARFDYEAKEFLVRIEETLNTVTKRLGFQAIPASPYRRMDAGAIGSIVAGYPLQLWKASDERMQGTLKYLTAECLTLGGFFQDMTHSGVNPYLTLHMAQNFLRVGNPKYFDLMKAVAALASPTGQWPEAIHPRTKGGCMGDGQHVWAAAEWIMMLRNCFVREEEDASKLVLCSGIPREWLKPGETLTFGPTQTVFGSVKLSIKAKDDHLLVEWDAQWFDKPPRIEVSFPDFPGVSAAAEQNMVQVRR
jgi:hypothetical protein